MIVVWSLAWPACPGCGEVKPSVRDMPAELVVGGEEEVQPTANLWHECGHYWGPLVFRTMEMPDDLSLITQAVHEVGAAYDQLIVHGLEE